jgi:hypothetical protein
VRHGELVRASPSTKEVALMMKHLMVLVAVLAMLVLSAAPAALALNCDNVSRQPPKGASRQPIIKGLGVVA